MNKMPLVMCLTNTVAADITANVLLAIGAKPAMVEEPSEAAELAMVADAVLINLGTVHPRQAEAMRAAIKGNGELGIGNGERGMGTVPWVLDPVACHLLSYRGELAKEFVSRKPTLIRGNHAEIDYLMETVPEKMGSVPVLSTGEVDKIYSPFPIPNSPTSIAGGVPMLQTITATGCSQGAICAAMLGRGLSPLDAAMAASKLMKRAGELAWEKAKAPGSFRVALIDALYELSQADVL